MPLFTITLLMLLAVPIRAADDSGPAAQERAAAPAPSAAPVRERLIGAWRLVRYEIFDAAGGPTRPGAYDEGQIVYERSGRMSAHLMNSVNRPAQAPATDADRAAAYRRYVGYYGPFTVDEAKGVVVHHVRGSSNPGWVGTDLVRYYSLGTDGNTLTLSLRNAERVTQSLHWERVK